MVVVGANNIGQYAVRQPVGAIYDTLEVLSSINPFAKVFACEVLYNIAGYTLHYIWGGGGGKALTMTMTPWNLTHGQWSKNLTMATDILESVPCSMVEMVILWSSLLVKSNIYHFDHRKFAFRPWP